MRTGLFGRLAAAACRRATSGRDSRLLADASPLLPATQQGGNQAAAAARLGCPTKLVAQLGRDGNAQM